MSGCMSLGPAHIIPDLLILACSGATSVIAVSLEMSSLL